MWSQKDRVFLRAKWRQTVRRWKRLNLNSILQSSGFLLLVGFFWVLSYKVVATLCYKITNEYPVIGPLVLDRILSFGFFAALIIVTLGHVLTAYSALFRGPGLPQLISSPYPIYRMYRIQCLETLFLGGWVSGLFCIPILAAFGWELNASFWYYPAVLAGLLGFLITAGMVGILIILVISRFILGRAMRTAIGSVLVLVFFFSVILYTAIANRDLLSRIEVSRLGEALANLRLSSHPYLPSHWMAQLMQSAQTGNIGRTLLFGGLLISSAWFFWCLAMELGHRWYHSAWFWSQEHVRLFSHKHERRQFRVKRMWLRNLLPRRTGAIIFKEIRLFLRDFSQWGQMVLILVLILFYVAHTQNYTPNEPDSQNRNIYAFFNVVLLGFVQVTLSLRYTFPSISLEGKAFWVVVTSGAGLERFFFTKYYLHAAVLLGIGLGMGFALNHTLGVDSTVNIISLFVLFLFSFGFTSWSMGLGAIFHKFEATGAADVTSDTGALITMIITLLYFALSIYELSIFTFTPVSATDLIGQFAINPILILNSAFFLLVQTCVILIPPAYGLRKLNLAHW